MKSVEIGPVPSADRTQPAFDLFLIFAAANIVATTLVTGASLVPAFSTRQALVLIVAGVAGGTAIVATLAPLGPRLGVPSIIVARTPLGMRGAALLALLLYVSNFAWIALNNVIAASAAARVLGGVSSERLWAVLVGVLATAIVSAGPRAVGRADRLAVPLMLVAGLALTTQVVRLPGSVMEAPAAGGMGLSRGLDVVVGYQVSWILMFADYSRYTPSPTRGALAVYLGLGLTSLWLMTLGALAGRVAGSADPGAMMAALGLGAAGALLVALGTVTTNFVNIYLSALAWRSLFPRSRDRSVVWTIGLVGTVLAFFSRDVLERYADFMLLLGGLFVPVGGILLAHFFLLRLPTDVAQLYEARGAYAYTAGFHVPALVAWVAGAAVYFAAGGIGGTLPALATAMLAYGALERFSS